jgi:hypothetical protein
MIRDTGLCHNSSQLNFILSRGGNKTWDLKPRYLIKRLRQLGTNLEWVYDTFYRAYLITLNISLVFPCSQRPLNHLKYGCFAN